MRSSASTTAHAALFEFYHGPERKVYTDPRLEVTGPALYARYMKLAGMLQNYAPGWQAELDRIGRPVVLTDHEYSDGQLCHDARRRPLAVRLVRPDRRGIRPRSGRGSGPAACGRLRSAHFQPDSSSQSRRLIERIALAKAFRSYSNGVPSHRSDLVWPLVWLGLDNCRGILREVPDSTIGWKMLGQTEIAREPAPPLPSPRYRLPFDPVADLSLVRATYALRHAARTGAGRHDIAARAR